ncbi:MAG TPA: hypothetical protein VFW00_07385 [Rhodocyclaceae bacterium]|nr:hypothetical protein [Rhodocyclaceae bacterium]
MKILILKRDKLGDVLLTTPMIRVLREALPQAEIHVLANDYNGWVLDGNRDVNRVWTYGRLRVAGRLSMSSAWRQIRLFFALRVMHFDWVLVANGEESHRAIRRAMRAGGRRIVAYCKDPATYPCVTHPLAPNDVLHETRQLANVLVPLGISVPQALPWPHFKLPVEGDGFARQWLAERSVPLGGYITLGLGARRAKKQPTAQQVLTWAKYFFDTWGLATVFIWTPGASDNPLYPGDDEVAQHVLNAKAAWLHPFRGPIKLALGLIWHGRTSLFPDSGLMHFAAACPGGVLGFFAETDVSPPPSRWGPMGPNAHYLEAEKTVAELEDTVVLDAVRRQLGMA